MLCTRPERNQIVKEIAENWGRRCTGIIKDGCYFGAKLGEAVVDVMMQYCPNTFRRTFGSDLRAARLGIPPSIIEHLARLADRDIKIHYDIPTWYYPNDDDICPSDFQEYITDAALLHQSDVLVNPGTRWIDECTWVHDPQGCPLAEGDTPHPHANQDGNPINPDEYWLQDKQEDDPAVLEAAQIYVAYVAWWNQDPREASR